MAGVIQKAQKMQEKVQAIQEKLKAEEVTGSSGAGLVTIVMSGAHEAKSIRIENSVLEDKDMLEDLITAAVNDATHKINQKNKENMQNITDGILPSGIKLPF